MANFKNPVDLAKAINPQASNKYNLKPTSEIRPFTHGSLSQEIGSTYNRLSDLYGIDMEDLVYGDKGFMKTRYPNNFPDFQGDLVYNDKYWDEFEKWLKTDKDIDLMDRKWERYKLDPDYFERTFTPDLFKQIQEYGAKVEPNSELLKRKYPEWRF